MGKYLSLAEQCLQDLKPKVEERTGVKLEDLIVKDPCKVPEFSEEEGLMFTTTYHLYDNVVFVNEKNCEEEKLPVPYGVTHEIVHKVHEKLMEKELDRAGKAKLPTFLWNMWNYRRYNQMPSFREGFAAYMSLDRLVDIHDDAQTLQEITEKRRSLGSYQDFEPGSIPYEKGYKFFRKVLHAIGQDKVFDVAKSPPMGEIEVKIPLLYILRKYPLKGIWKMPEFFARSVTTKIVKAICGYADFDFPNHVKKGSGKGKVFKALPYSGFFIKEMLPSCRFLIEDLNSKTKNPSPRSLTKTLRALREQITLRKNYHKPQKIKQKF